MLVLQSVSWQVELGKSNIKSFALLFVSKSQQGKGFGYVATVLRLGRNFGGVCSRRPV